jgi:hypothetical protein
MKKPFDPGRGRSVVAPLPGCEGRSSATLTGGVGLAAETTG